MTYLPTVGGSKAVKSLMTVWRKTGKIIRNCHFRYICIIIIGSSYNFRFPSFSCVLRFIKVKLSVEVKLFVPLLLELRIITINFIFND